MEGGKKREREREGEGERMCIYDGLSAVFLFTRADRLPRFTPYNTPLFIYIPILFPLNTNDALISSFLSNL